MYVEEHMYVLQVGKVPEYLKIHKSEGMAIQRLKNMLAVAR